MSGNDRTRTINENGIGEAEAFDAPADLFDLRLGVSPGIPVMIAQRCNRRSLELSGKWINGPLLVGGAGPLTLEAELRFQIDSRFFIVEI